MDDDRNTWINLYVGTKLPKSLTDRYFITYCPEKDVKTAIEISNNINKMATVTYMYFTNPQNAWYILIHRTASLRMNSASIKKD